MALAEKQGDAQSGTEPRPYAEITENLSSTPSLIAIDAVERYFATTLPFTADERQQLVDALETIRRLLERAASRSTPSVPG
jgi:hypothetical protein